MSSILFALSIDRAELNDTMSCHAKAEPIIPLPLPVKSNQMKRKTLRQVISFDKNDSHSTSKDNRKCKEVKKTVTDEPWNSAPPTCLSSPDATRTTYQNPISSISEPTSSEVKSIRQFFPESVRSMDSPSQILTRLSECAKEIFSSTQSVDASIVHNKDDVSDLSINNLKLSESDSEEAAGSMGSTSCLELCFTEDEGCTDEKMIQVMLSKKEKDNLDLQLKCSELEISSKEKVQKLEKVVLDLSK